MASDLYRLRGLRILVVEDTFMLADELDKSPARPSGPPPA
jgi:hypothetical protein